MPSATWPRAVHRVPGQARYLVCRSVLHRVHGQHAVRVANNHRPVDGKVPEDQHRTGQERHLQEGVQLVLHNHVHMRTTVGVSRAQLVPDQRGQPEPQEPDTTHMSGKRYTIIAVRHTYA